jgi:plasmid maintenance system antidote protein VapI
MTKRQRWVVLREAGHSGSSLALRLGVSKQTVCRHLNGDQFSHDSAERIATHLGLSLRDMWPKAPRKAAA